MSKDTELVYKIVKKTHEGALVWKRSRFTPSSLVSTDTLLGYCYETEIGEARFLVYEYQYRHYTDMDEWNMYNGVRLEIIDDQGASLHIFSNDSCGKWINQLASLAKFQAEQIASKIKGAISALDDLLPDE